MGALAGGDRDDTIAAIATAPGEGALGVVRVSGPAAFAVAERVFRPARGGGRWEGFRARYGWAVHPRSGEVLDEVVALAMVGPRSYTGEDVVEFSCHGGPVVLRRVLEAVLAAGARLAEPGEFTRRAFLNGRIDLAQAEAVIDLIRARGEWARRAALAQLGGALSRRLREVREGIVRCLAHVEALLDFPEDEVEAWGEAELRARVEELAAEVAGLSAGYEAGRLVREGVRVAIVGRPNVGKSSVLNALLGEDRALVTAVPGTTRDVIEEGLVVEGVPLVLADTAGIREAGDEVERLGIERAREVLRDADVILLVVDAAAGWTEGDEAVAGLVDPERAVIALNKVDLGRPRVERAVLERLFAGRPVVEVSALEGRGIEELRRLLARAAWSGVAPREGLLVTRARHRDALERCREGLERAGAALREGLPADVVAAELRRAAGAVGEITGETVDEAVLETVFREFCLGK